VTPSVYQLSTFNYQLSAGPSLNHQLSTINSLHAPASSAMDAVYPWMKFVPPIGPISPLQKNPAAGMRPNFSETASASWLGTPKRFLPRPLQQNSSDANGCTPCLRAELSS